MERPAGHVPAPRPAPLSGGVAPPAPVSVLRDVRVLAAGVDHHGDSGPNQNTNARHQYERQFAAWTYEQRRWEIARAHWQAQQIGYAVRQQFDDPRNSRELY